MDSDVDPEDTSGGRASPVTYTAVASGWLRPLEPFVLPMFDADVYEFWRRGLLEPYGSYGLPYCVKKNDKIWVSSRRIFNGSNC